MVSRPLNEGAPLGKSAGNLQEYALPSSLKITEWEIFPAALLGSCCLAMATNVGRPDHAVGQGWIQASRPPENMQHLEEKAAKGAARAEQPPRKVAGRKAVC